MISRNETPGGSDAFSLASALSFATSRKPATLGGTTRSPFLLINTPWQAG